MASTEEVVQRLRDSRPPATDTATYLTILEKSMSPEILPALQEILEDVQLTNDIGWDLVEMLISIPGSEACLEAVARLGNPREVVLKVLEVMDKTSDDDSSFVTLCGMLGILHKRLQVKAPSRFLHTTLDTVYRAYDGRSAAATAAIISLVQSLTPHTRPPLPSRKSSTRLETPFFQDCDASKRAPDPEADGADAPSASEPRLVVRLLQSFITCVIEAFANVNCLEWASRLLEYTYPERIVTGRKSMMQTFRETVELQAKDALVGQLVSLAGDLGLASIPPFKMRELLEAPICADPLSEELGEDAELIRLSTGGLLCLNAYWMFASDVFDADRGLPDDTQSFPQRMLPDHHTLLANFLGDEPQVRIAANPGSVEALVVMAVALESRGRVTADQTSSAFMPYHHLLTLVSVFHPNLRVRNAATVVSGNLLHADPDEDSRLAIMEDLLENCMFPRLQACAVTWLREEIIAANGRGRFASPECLESIQYTLFPDLTRLDGEEASALMEFWLANAPLHLQVANFVLFLFGERYKGLTPAGMAAAIEHRYVEPLMRAARVLEGAVERRELGADGDVLMQLRILIDTLGRVPLQ